jgi:hypothetical protein
MQMMKLKLTNVMEIKYWEGSFELSPSRNYCINWQE